MDKTKIPLYIHEVLEKHIAPHSDKFELTFKHSLLRLITEVRAKKPNENFYLRIRPFLSFSNFVDVICSPYSEARMKGSHECHKNSESLGEIVEEWLRLVLRYSAIQSPFFDDPVTQGYEDEFFNQWKIMEDDADTKPFDLQRQLLIDKYLESAIQKLEAQKTKENEKEIEAIKTQANEVRQNLTRQTKNQVVRGLAKFWAMARKMGLDVLREIFIELASGVIQKMLIG